jgi:hypothetical protein
MALWLSRAGGHGEYEKRFLNDRRIYLTWEGLTYDLSELNTKQELRTLLEKVYENSKALTIRNWVGQIWAFTHDMSEGDWIVLPSKIDRRVLHYGEITGPYVFDKDAEDPFLHYRSVRWVARDVPRAAFKRELLPYFNLPQTICRLNGHRVEGQVRAVVEPKGERAEPSGFAKARLRDSRGSDRFNTSSAGLKNLVRFGETDRVEFKTKLPSDDIIVQNMSAFANTDGGILLIGVSDDGEIIGIPQGELGLTINRVRKIAASLFPFPVEVGETEVDGRPVVYAVVERPSPEYLPLMTARGEFYQRRSDKNIRMKYSDLLEFVDLNSGLKRKVQQPVIVFVAMSFKEEEEPALVDYFKAMERAALATHLPLDVRRMDLEEGDYEISQKIMDKIDDSDIVIADFTLNARNVYFEAGYARGRHKRIIQTARKDTGLEFDVRNWKTLFYRNATELETKLVPALLKAYNEVSS